MLKKHFIKLLLLFLIISFPLFNVTNAYLSDEESTDTNTFNAGSVEMSLRDSDENLRHSPLFDIDDMSLGDSETKLVKVTKEGDLNFKYSIKAVKTAGDDELCDALDIEAKLDGVSKYDGDLTGLNLHPAATISGSSDDWTFEVKLDSSDLSLERKSCEFDLEFKAWQTSSDGSWGLKDEKTISSKVETDDWAPESPSGLKFIDHEDHDLGCGGTIATDNIHVKLDWHDSTASDFDHFDYEDNDTDSGEVTDSKHEIELKDENGTYKYRVRTVDDGDHSSDWSGWCSVKLELPPVPPTP